jgi:CHAD domain-containing protein
MAHATTQVNRALARQIAVLLRAVGEGLARARRGDERAVHATRVGARRLREAVAIAGQTVSGGDAARAGRELRRMRRALGPVREADVMRNVLEAEQARHAWSPLAVATLRQTLDAERKKRVRRSSRVLRSVRVVRLRQRLRTLTRDLETRPDDHLAREAVTIRARRRAVELARALMRVGTLYSPPRLHAVRLAAKKLRYVLELADETTVWDASGQVAQLREMQDALGHLNDNEMLLAEARAAASRLAGEAVEAEAIRDVALGLEVETRRLHAGLVQDLPALASLASDVSAVATASLAGRRRMLRMGADPRARSAAAGRSTVGRRRGRA